MTRLVYDAEMTMLWQSNLIENEPSLEALRDAMEAWEYLTGHYTLDDDVVRRTHELVMQSRDLSEKYKGFYRTIPVYIGRVAKMQYNRIPADMTVWLHKMNQPVDAVVSEDRAEESQQIIKVAYAKALHVEYEDIHPFVDGNGRTGRMFYNWHRLKLGLPVHVIHSDQGSRSEYYRWFE